ncbi:MAG TPA: thiamine pyrophosphate-dependent dehydrogenase E1 component subunit alpha [Thermoanaerobaculia bacterium]|jgi:pyruvate dehydrogenase E1 component alpha subunit|nr:thiamine pyrophosphate-dependent dehydrogenase E1 component subunit alpha [Thermoanaerobaculia bacterium]
METAIDRGVAEALETMLTIRTFEEKSAELNATGKVGSVCTSVGQEASAVGVVSTLQSNDLILTNHRSAGHLIARGADPGRLFAEIAGKATGYCKGKSGSLHISVKELGVVLTSTIVGGELSLAPGVGLSLSMQDTDAIAVVFFGDGAATEGVFHEALNIAGVWNLPVLFVCENNQWQAFVHRKEAMLTDHVSEWARPYGMPAVTVDGNDVEAVNAAAREAVAYVRKNRKPYFLETYTYRLRGHLEPDDQAYVNKDELAAWKKKDPIATLEARLLQNETLTATELEEMKARVQQTIESAAAFAMASPYPSFAEMTTDVYA